MLATQTVNGSKTRSLRLTGPVFGPAPYISIVAVVALGFCSISSGPALAADTTPEFRTFSGEGNNRLTPQQGQAGQPFLRLLPADYEDGSSSPGGSGRPSSRLVSNVLCAEDAAVPAEIPVSDLFWQWGQFVDHDITLTPGSDPEEGFDIAVPSFDPEFDPEGTGNATIPMNRSVSTAVGGQREQVNFNSSYLDASMVYGSDSDRVDVLRAFDGRGRLATSNGRRLIRNETGLPNDPSPALTNLFLAGDVRANEQPGLLALHTLFLREHNRLASRTGLLRKTLKALGGDPESELDGELRYQLARTLVAAEVQAITYREFLPLLLGDSGLAAYTGYKVTVDASISNVFAAAAFRFGHTLLPAEIQRMRRNGEETRSGHISLRDGFFNPDLVARGGIASILRGLANHRSQELDLLIVEDVRSFLFGSPGQGGLDLAALNIQRGRDHGLPSYNGVRRGFGLVAREDFSEVSSDQSLASALEALYTDTDDIDFWVGMLAEDHLPGAMVGETLAAVLVDQFSRTRDGDRFWYEEALSGRALRFVERRTLAKILRSHTRIEDETGPDAFLIAE